MKAKQFLSFDIRYSLFDIRHLNSPLYDSPLSPSRFCRY